MVSFELSKEKYRKMFSSCHERGTKKKFWVPMRNRTSDLWIPHSDALSLSHRDSTVSKVYYGARNPKVWGSIPHGDSEFFLCPTLWLDEKHLSLIKELFDQCAAANTPSPFVMKCDKFFYYAVKYTSLIYISICYLYFREYFGEKIGIYFAWLGRTVSNFIKSPTQIWSLRASKNF